MSNDLISRSKLIEQLCKACGQDECQGLRVDTEFRCNAIKWIEELPTAFDKDRVVKQLKQQAEQYHRRGNEYENESLTESNTQHSKAYSYEHAIEIVNNGGVEEVRNIKLKVCGKEKVR